MRKIGVYAGTFDPLTNGHIDVVNQFILLFDEFHIMIGKHPDKQETFTIDERLEILKKTFPNEVQIGVLSPDGIIGYINRLYEAWDYKVKIAQVRGLRNDKDFLFEQENNDVLVEQGITTLFAMTSGDMANISSSEVKRKCVQGYLPDDGSLQQIAYLPPGWNPHKISHLVPIASLAAMLRKKEKLQTENQYVKIQRADRIERVRTFFDKAVKNGFFTLNKEIDASYVRNMLDTFPVDVVVSDKFILREIDLYSVEPTGERYVAQSCSLGPIIVDRNLTLPHLKDNIVIEGKHRWLEAKERYDSHIMAWVGEKATI